MLLGQLFGQRVQVGQVLHHPGGLTEADALLAAELLRRTPVLTGPQAPQRAVQLGQGIHQLRRTEGLLRQRVQLGPLLGGERVAHPLRGGRTLGQGIQQLVDVARILGEELAVLGHELVEVGLRVLPAGMLLQQGIQVIDHLLDPGAVLVGRVLQRLLHPREPLVQLLPAEQLGDLLVRLPGCAGAPLIVTQLVDRGRRRRRQILQLQFGESGVVVQIAGQLLAFGQHRLIEQLAYLVQRAVEAMALQQLLPLLGDPASQLIQTGPIPITAAQELLHRALRRGALHHVATDLLQRLGQIHRRRQRIRAVVIRPVRRAVRVTSSPHRGHQPYTAP